MTFNSVWLIVLTMLRSLPALMLLAGAAQAATVNLNFNGGAVANCSYSSQVYTCTGLLGSNDTGVIAIGSGYTVVVSNDVALKFGQGLQMTGSAKLQTTGSNDLDLSASQSLNVSGGTLAAGGNFKLGASSQSITANVTAASVTTAGASTYINGSVSATGAITLGSSSTITGAVSGASISTGSSSTLGALTISGAVDLGSSNTINGAVNAASIKTSSSVVVNGAVSVSGLADLGSGIKITGNLSGATIDTDSPANVTGNVTATSSFTLSSGSTVTGNITSPTVKLNASGITVKGDIAASGTLDIGSGSTVNGNLSGGALTMRASGVTVNGNASFSGDVDMGSGDTINGNLSARNVTTHASGATINGNAAVNAIYLDWGASVSKTITCTGAAPGSPVCSCVTKADSNYQPTCGAPPLTGADHILITHGGGGLTCQPQAVTLTACANATCTAPHYNGTLSVTLNPGNGVFPINSGTNSAATVQRSIAGPIGLTASSAGVSGATQCQNTSTGVTNAGSACQMNFSDQGLVITAPDHVSMKSANILIRALQASATLPGCVPLLKNVSQASINMGCAYVNPAAAANTKVNVGGTAVSCGGSTIVKMDFDSNGLSTQSLKYPESGTVNMTASYSSGNLNAAGSDSFTAAPEKFTITATRVAGPGNVTPTAFARASEPYTLTLSAVNAEGTVTTNFGKEDSPESFNLTYALKAPAMVDATTTGAFNAIVNGTSSSKTGSTGLWKFDETGTVTFTARLANASKNYMGNNTTGFATTGTVDLLFIPDHFDTVLTGTVPMACNKLGGANPCAAANTNGSFVYSRQPFDIIVYPYIGAKDVNGNYLSPQNYVDTGAAVITLSAADGAGSSSTIPATGVDSGVINWSGGASAARFAFTYDPATKKNIGKLTAVNWPSFNFTNTPSKPTTIFVRAVDANGASSLRSGAVEAPLTVVSGGLAVTNNYGSLSAPLPITAQALFWNGSAYVANSQFGLVSPATSPVVSFPIGANISYRNCQNGLYTANSPTSCPAMSVTAPGTLAFKDGKALFRLNPPSSGISVNGSVEVLLQSPVANAPPLIPYLPSVAAGRQTFGIYRSGPVIYTREVHN
jgi:MSHA biogenesis protein MshQ